MAERIYWTELETSKLCDKFVEFRIRHPFDSSVSLLEKCQELTLPPERRRKCGGVPAYGNELVQKMKTRFALMSLPPCPAPTPVTLEPSSPVLAPATTAQEVVTIVEIEVPKVVTSTEPIPLSEVIKTCTAGQLIGAGIDKLLAQGRSEPAQQVLSKILPPIFVPAPPPPEARIAKHRVVVCGVFPEMQRYVEQKVANMAKLDIRWCDSNQNSVNQKIQADFVILMRRIVSHSIAEQVRRMVHHNRIIYVEAGQDELVQKLADLNSRQ